MVNSEWFYRHDGHVYGPVSLEDLRAAISLGFVDSSDLVRQRIVGEWCKAADLLNVIRNTHPDLTVTCRASRRLRNTPSAIQDKRA